MDLNNLELPGFVFADLYKDLLVREKEPSPGIPQGISSFKYLGGNKKKLTILVNYEETVFLPEKNLQFVTKMLEACKMNIGDVAIVNLAKNPATISDIKREVSPVNLILFAVEPAAIKLPLGFPQFKTQAYDGCTFLYLPPIDEVDQPTLEGKLLKSKLWICLRNLFEL